MTEKSGLSCALVVRALQGFSGHGMGSDYSRAFAKYIKGDFKKVALSKTIARTKALKIIAKAN